jgi:NAD(P)-dependent dehydrogenase (short-subunit alcohol dehydrogenase family)
VSRPPLTLAGRTAIVTGAGSGIGRALAQHAAARGITVAACDVDAAGLAGTMAALGDGHWSMPLDITDGAMLQAFAQHAAADLPPVALVFANAGILRQGSVATTSIEDWRALFTINVIGTVQLIQSFVPLLDGPAQIVVTGSVGSMATQSGLAAYCATKHALWPICDLLRDELAEAGRPIGVSLLMPGAVSTQIFAAAAPARTEPKDSIAPAEAARIAFEGALADRPLILTHPQFVARAEVRFAQALADLRGADLR